MDTIQRYGEIPTTISFARTSRGRPFVRIFSSAKERQTHICTASGIDGPIKLEDFKMTKSRFGTTAATATMLAAFSLATVHNAAAETDVYKDVLRPNGQARSNAAKWADFAACGWRTDTISDSEFQKANKCMNRHGWVIDHIVQDRANKTVSYNRESKNPNIGWHGGVCKWAYNNCDDPEIPGSGFTCRTIADGRRECTRQTEFSKDTDIR
jgi:hypothetical protein